MFTFNDNIEVYSKEELNFINEYELGQEGFDFLKLFKTMWEEKENPEVVKTKKFSKDFATLLSPLYKVFCKRPKISRIKHQKRNSLQFNWAPEHRDQMEILVELGLYYKLSHTASHNLTPEDNHPEGRWRWSLVLDRDNGNLDYRGSINMMFEGAQFIYNEKTNKIVTGDLNKGTWDFCSPLRNVLGHFDNDIVPWVLWGNMGDDPASKITMNKNTWRQIELQYKNYVNKKFTKDEVISNISQIMMIK